MNQPAQPHHRQAICLDCRAALPAGATCDGGLGHRVVDLRNGHGREQLLTEVWGPPDMRRRLKQMAAAGGAGAAGSSLIVPGCELGCEALVFDAGIGLAVMAIVGLFMLLYVATVKTIHAVERRRNRPVPNGARILPRLVRGHPNRGKIKRVDQEVQAASGRRAAAFGFRLLRKKSHQSELMLTDGEGGGMTLETDAGEALYIPPGRLRLEAPEARYKEVPTEGVKRYLDALDGDYLADPDELALIPHDRALEATLRVGDQVEVRGRLERRADPSREAAGYRDGAAGILVPVGVPRIKLLER